MKYPFFLPPIRIINEKREQKLNIDKKFLYSPNRLYLCIVFHKNRFLHD